MLGVSFTTPHLAAGSGLARVLVGAAAAVVVAVLAYMATALEVPVSGEVLTLQQASLLRPGQPTREVTLPHTWTRDGLPGAGRGTYRIAFTLDRLPDLPWGLEAARMPSRHEVRLNGHRMQRSGLDDSAPRRGAPVPMWIDIVPDAFVLGHNLIEVEFISDYRAGLSPLRLGPEDAVWPYHVRDDALWSTIPRSLNLFGLGLALFLVWIWWRRPGELALGLFAALLALLSLRNVGYADTGTVTHTASADALIYLANVVGAMLMARFALAWSGRRWRAFALATDWGGSALLAAGLAAAPFGATQALRALAYPLLLASLAPSLLLMVLGARREAGGMRVALLATVLALCVAQVHDYFYVRGLLEVTGHYWMPYATPAALAVFASTLLERFVNALGVVENQAADLERRVEQRTRELAAANAAKTRFVAAASHDLRQPVVAISLLAGLLRDHPLPQGTQRLVDRIDDSINALNGLLQGLLDLSRFDAGAVTPRREAVPLRPLLEAALADEREVARRKGLALRLRVHDLAVLTDRTLIEQILRNLIGNAVRYTDRGGVLVASRRGAGNAVRVQVWDTGRGIAPHEQQMVFEEFVQLDNVARERARGLGLGLSLVQRAAALLGAPLRLRSRPGRGSCFEIELPLATPAPRDALEPADTAARPLAGCAAWVVDDEPEVRAAVELRLSAWGAEVCSFAGARTCEAAAAAATTAPDVVVTDQRLPDGQGVELAARLRERFGAALPVLLISGDTAPHDLQHLAASGLVLLHKPFDGATLLRAIAGVRAAAAMPGHSTDGQAAAPHRH